MPRISVLERFLHGDWKSSTRAVQFGHGESVGHDCGKWFLWSGMVPEVTWFVLENGRNLHHLQLRLYWLALVHPRDLSISSHMPKEERPRFGSVSAAILGFCELR